MIRAIIITDNIIQYERFKRLIIDKGRKDLTVKFCHSPIRSALWDHSDAIEVIDVKKDTARIAANFDLVISIHCLQLFPKNLVNSVRCINIHPGYNPINRGWYPQVFSIINNLPIGATIHEMDEELDHGPIIARKMVQKFDWDTSLTLYDRVL